MKKQIAFLLSLLMLFSLFAGCGAVNNDAIYENDLSAAFGEKSEVAIEEPAAAEMTAAADEAVVDTAYEEESGIVEAGELTHQTDMAEKIIYSAYADIETTEFDKSVDRVYDLLDRYDGFVENSYVSGSNYNADYYDYAPYRSADFTVRVPVDVFTQVKGELSSIGNVIGLSTNAENVTMQYTDTESRLNAYKTEEGRLLELLETAANTSDIIVIEQRLSEVRYEIDTLTSQLKNLQNQVDYSTVQICIQEVEELTEQVKTQRTYWQKIGDGFVDTLQGIGVFFKELFRIVLSALPLLILIAIIVIAVLLIIKASKTKKYNSQRSKKSKNSKKDAKADTVNPIKPENEKQDAEDK